MKNLISLVVIAAACLLVQKFLPWWSGLIVIALFTAIMGVKPGKAVAFGAGILACIWLGYAMLLNFGNQGVLAAKIGEIFKGVSTAQLLGITFFLGGLLGGLAALTGSLFRRMISRKV